MPIWLAWTIIGVVIGSFLLLALNASLDGNWKDTGYALVGIAIFIVVVCAALTLMIHYNPLLNGNSAPSLQGNREVKR